MRLEQLEQIIKLADTGSFSQAAKDLYIAQPSLSRSIKQLETEVGFQIFERTRSGVIPSERGLELIGRARLISRECQTLCNDFLMPEKQRRPTLRIGCFHSRNTAFVPEIYQKYAQSPLASVMMDFSSLHDMIEFAAACRLDFAILGTISYNLPNVKSELLNKEMEYHPFARSNIYAAVGPKSPLYDLKKTVTRDMLRRFTVISYGDTDGANTHNYAVALDVENSCRASIRTNNSGLLYQMVHESESIGLVDVPEPVLRRFCRYDDIRLLEIEDVPFNVEFGWTKPRRLPLSDLAYEALEGLMRSYQP